MTIHYICEWRDLTPDGGWDRYHVPCRGWVGFQSQLNWDITKVTCPECKETDMYKNDLFYFELVCEGSRKAWHSYMSDRQRNGEDKNIFPYSTFEETK